MICGPDLPGYGGDPDCLCEGTGLDPIAYARQQSRACPWCRESAPERLAHPPQPMHVDKDGDGWLDGVERATARWARGYLREPVRAVVMHRLHRGYHGAGPRYAMTTSRKVSWHFTIHRPGWTRALTQHAPIDRRCWHAGRANGWSLGLEHDYPGPDGYSSEQMDVSERLVAALQELLPSLKWAIAHAALSPATRSDPGAGFDWGRFEALGLRVARTPGELPEWAR